MVVFFLVDLVWLGFVAKDFYRSSIGHLMGEGFTVADAYLFTVLNWCKVVKLDLGKWPVLTAYLGRIASRPAVPATLKAEGFLK